MIEQDDMPVSNPAEGVQGAVQIPRAGETEKGGREIPSVSRHVTVEKVEDVSVTAPDAQGPFGSLGVKETSAE